MGCFIPEVDAAELTPGQFHSVPDNEFEQGGEIEFSGDLHRHRLHCSHLRKACGKRLCCTRTASHSCGQSRYPLLWHVASSHTP